MKKLILLLMACLILTGCSLIPRVNFDTPNTVPQSVDKSKAKDVCKGQATFNENGDITSCSKGYSSFAQNYVKEERKYTLKEKIINIFRNLKGIAFWIAVALVIFCPGVLGMIVGRIIEAIFGISKKALSSTIKGVQKARKEGKPIDDALASSQDEKVKKYIRKLKEEENIK